MHAMLATQPGPDLAVTLASKRRGLQHPVDQLVEDSVWIGGLRQGLAEPGGHTLAKRLLQVI